jgi:hypothetical protein
MLCLPRHQDNRHDHHITAYNLSGDISDLLNYPVVSQTQAGPGPCSFGRRAPFTRTRNQTSQAIILHDCLFIKTYLWRRGKLRMPELPHPTSVKSNVNPSVPGRTVCRDTFSFGGWACSDQACKLPVPPCIDSVDLGLLPGRTPAT